MADETQPESFEGAETFYYFLGAIGFLALCFYYCCRHEEPADDPADDLIGGYLPNPTRQPTESLEDRRKHIEDSIITRKVIADDEISVSSETNSASKRSSLSLMKRLSHSDRTFSSYALVLSGFSHPSRRVSTKFSNQLFRHSTSLPISFNDDSTKPDDDPDRKSQSVRGFTDEEKQMIGSTKIKEEEEEDGEQSTPNSNDHDSDIEIPNGIEEEEVVVEQETLSPKHRRKADIIARTLSRILRGPQDYDMPTTCDICLMEYEVGEEVAWSRNEDCIHAFHKECIVDWLLRSPNCPLCRNEYVVDAEGE